MADPLAAMAEREVPAPTNYFDPAAAQTVISRYASARRRAESSGAVAEAESQALSRRGQTLRIQDDEESLARRRMTWDRDDADYFERKDALANQGAFLDAIAGLKTDDPDEFDRTLSETLKGVHSEVLEQAGTKALLTHKTRMAEEARRRRDASATREESYDYWQKKFEKGAGLKTAMKGATPEMFARHTDPATGQVDFNAVASESYANNETAKQVEWDRKYQAGLNGRLKLGDKANMSKGARDLLDQAKIYINDPGAFRPQTDVVLEEFRAAKKNPKASKDLMTGEWLDKYTEAERWDSKPIEREIITAQRYEDPEDYVKLGGDKMNPNQIEYRKLIHRLSKKDDVLEEDMPQKGSTPPTETQRPAAGGASNSAVAPAKRKWNPETKKLE